MQLKTLRSQAGRVVSVVPLPQKLLQRLQLVQNASARVIATMLSIEQILAVWVSVKYLIHFKILLFTFKSLKKNPPSTSLVFCIFSHLPLHLDPPPLLLLFYHLLTKP